MMSSFGSGEERRAVRAESLARQAEQLLSDGEIDERRVDVAVPEVGGEVGQPALWVDPVPVPLKHAVDDERVA
jgi:hypothetical protein